MFLTLTPKYSVCCCFPTVISDVLDEQKNDKMRKGANSGFHVVTFYYSSELFVLDKMTINVLDVVIT